MNSKLGFWISLLCLLISSSSFSAEQAREKAHVLWDNWYTVTVGSKTHYGYYEEKVEARDSQLFMKVEYWKQEEDYINREDLGEVAKNDDTLTPVLFNFHSVYRTSETQIDGTIKDGKFFSARIKKAGNDLPIVERSIPSKTFLAQLFPVWLGKRITNPDGKFKTGVTLDFELVLEDSVDNGFQVQEGSVKWEKPDEFASTSGSMKFTTKINGMSSIWYTETNGSAVRIDFPEQKTTAVRVSKAVAKKFLDGT